MKYNFIQQKARDRGFFKTEQKDQIFKILQKRTVRKVENFGSSLFLNYHDSWHSWRGYRHAAKPVHDPHWTWSRSSSSFCHASDSKHWWRKKGGFLRCWNKGGLWSKWPALVYVTATFAAAYLHIYLLHCLASLEWISI